MSTLITAPVSYEAIAEFPDWRRDVAWPVTHAANRETCLSLLDAVLAHIARCDEAARPVMLLAAPQFVSLVLPWMLLARAIEAETETGIRLVGSLQQAAYLRGQEELAPQEVAFRPTARPRHLLLRRLMRIGSWAPKPAVPLSLLFPDATAISHNALLLDEARHAKQRIGFKHAEALYDDILQRVCGLDAAEQAEVETQGQAVLEAMLAVLELGQEMRLKVARIVTPAIHGALAKARAELTAAGKVKGLPQNIWSGTGGYWPSRLIGLEALRRGGEVTRFQHGSSAGMLKVVGPIALTELSVSSRFVTATDRTAENLRASAAPALIADYAQPEIRGGRGEHHILQLASRSKPRQARRRRVLYGPTIMCGFRQFVPPILPDPVHLDWQMRMTEKLSSMPVELVLRPHPEGLLKGKRHPLNDITAVSQHNYEKSMDEADVFIFDYDQSTTFYEALCTDKPIVFVHMGNELFADNVWEMINRRCHVIRAEFDDRNRPQIDMAQFEEAVLNSPYKADGSEFRAMVCNA